MEKKIQERIYATNGKHKIFGMKAIINGKLSLAYFEGDKIVAYTSWEEVNRQMYLDSCQEFKVEF